MNSSVIEWTLEGFIEYFAFVNRGMLDHKFAWTLGAGASYASGIPLGSQLVDFWLTEMHRRHGPAGSTVEQWATAESLGIVGFQYGERATFYPAIYQKRFRDYPEEGYAYLESVMAGKDPSPGYSILAAALAADPPRHNVVITTNFDNLVADALSIYTDTFPFVCGHESLTSFVRVAMRRPLICKLHRDLLLGPQNDPRSLKRLHDSWGMALRALFQHYTPLFIGYGGNDDTLMDLLESLQPGDIKGQMIWCYHEGSKPSARISSVVADHKGVVVPVPDFDLLMVLIGETMGIDLLDEEIGRRAEQRTTRYRDRIVSLDTVEHPAVTKALAAIVERSGGWFAWHKKAGNEKDRVRRVTVYRQGLEHYPKSGFLRCAAGRCIGRNGDWVEGLRLSLEATEIEPQSAALLCFCAENIMESGGSYEKAEMLMRQAVTAKPDDAMIAGSFATFLFQHAEDVTDAEKYFQKSLGLRKNADYVGNYAGLLIAVGRLDDAEKQLALVRILGEKSAELQAELAFYEAVVAVARGRSDREPLEKIKTIQATDYERGDWNFDAVLRFVEREFPPVQYKFFKAVADGILRGGPINMDDLIGQRARRQTRSARKSVGPKATGKNKGTVGGERNGVGARSRDNGSDKAE